MIVEPLSGWYSYTEWSLCTGISRTKLNTLLCRLTHTVSSYSHLFSSILLLKLWLRYAKMFLKIHFYFRFKGLGFVQTYTGALYLTTHYVLSFLSACTVSMKLLICISHNLESVTVSLFVVVKCLTNTTYSCPKMFLKCLADRGCKMVRQRGRVGSVFYSGV